MKTILFQGDFITDCGRERESDTHMGTGCGLYQKIDLEVFSGVSEKKDFGVLELE